jgi:hypothetical protein
MLKKSEYEAADFLHKEWSNYRKNYDIKDDIEALIILVEGYSGIARNETEVLNTVYDSTMVVLDSSSQLDNEQKVRASYFSYNLCSCKACQTNCGAHINKKGQIRIAQKFFLDVLNQKTSSAIGVLELMYIILHEILHGIFPELNEVLIIEKTTQVWKSGIKELIKEK